MGTKNIAVEFNLLQRTDQNVVAWQLAKSTRPRLWARLEVLAVCTPFLMRDVWELTAGKLEGLAGLRLDTQ